MIGSTLEPNSSQVCMGIVSAVKKAMSSSAKPLDGPVTFDELAFGVALPKPRGLDWSSIEKIIIYKVDLLTYDEIRVQFEHQEGAVVITEESPGFGDLMKEAVRRFPVTADWHVKVSQPAFATCEIVLYERLSNERRV